MLTGIGYKNERLLTFSLDLLMVSAVAVITYLIFGFPHFFSYFKELEQASQAINPTEYLELTGEIHGRFERLLLEIGAMYWLYESLALILFGQTIGKKVFRKRMVFKYDGPGNKFFRILVFPTRTAIKVLCVYMMLPILIVGGQFLFSKTDKTLLDRIFLTQVEDVE